MSPNEGGWWIPHVLSRRPHNNKQLPSYACAHPPPAGQHTVEDLAGEKMQSQQKCVTAQHYLQTHNRKPCTCSKSVSQNKRVAPLLGRAVVVVVDAVEHVVFHVPAES